MSDEDEDGELLVGGIIGPRYIGSIAKRVLAGERLYQLEYRRCGKRPGSKGRPSGCKCMRSENPADWHGPYPYAYVTKRKKGGGVLRGGGGWKRLKSFPAEGRALLGLKDEE